MGLTSEAVFPSNEGIYEAIIKDRRSGKGQIIDSFAKEIMSIDSERALEVLKYLKRELRVQRNGVKFKDFDDFLE